MYLYQYPCCCSNCVQFQLIILCMAFIFIAAFIRQRAFTDKGIVRRVLSVAIANLCMYQFTCV